MSVERSPTDRIRADLQAVGVEAGAHLLVAVSGGADSVALLHLLRAVSSERGLTLSAAHFDHALRPESAADAAWVAELCGGWGVALVSERADAPPRGEAGARRARYAFLERARAERGAGWVVTAHHADDQAETVLFRAVRGSGPSGLAGIAPVDPARRLLRPLLGWRRAELRAYAAAEGLTWREDASNQLAGPARNRIRLRVLPELERVAPGAAAALARLAALAREDEAAWNALLAGELATLAEPREGGLVVARQRFRGYDSAVAARLLRALLRRFGVVPDRDGTRSALRFIGSAVSGRVLELPGGVRLTAEFAEVRIERAEDAAATADLPLLITAPGGEGSCRIGGRARRVRWESAASSAAHDEPWRQTLPVPDAAFPLLLRGRLPGDRVRTPAGTRTLKRLLIDRRVPLRERARVPVLADARGRVLWVAGVARSAPLLLPGQTGLTIEIRDA